MQPLYVLKIYPKLQSNSYCNDDATHSNDVVLVSGLCYEVRKDVTAYVYLVRMQGSPKNK